MTKYTEGPWFVSEIGVGFEVEDSKGNVIIHSQQLVGDKTNETRKANAQLAAAAPELLQILELIVERIDYYALLKDEDKPNIEDWAYTYNSTDMIEARTLIAKAKGE